MTWNWNIENWKTHDRFEEADKACKHACGLGLEEAWEDASGCNVRNVRNGFSGSHWMSPESVAEAIAFLYFDYQLEE